MPLRPMAPTSTAPLLSENAASFCWGRQDGGRLGITPFTATQHPCIPAQHLCLPPLHPYLPALYPYFTSSAPGL